MWIKRFFDNIGAWRESRRALRELCALTATEERTAIGGVGLDPVVLARSCLDRGDREGALRHWRDAFGRFPGYVGRSHEAVRIAIGLELFDEAEALARVARKRRPVDPAWCEVFAEVAEWRNDLNEAFARWSDVRKRFPQRPLSALRVAACLVRLDRVDEAEALLKLTMDKFPDLLVARADYARLVEYRGKWAEALEHWNHGETKFPASPEAVLGAARALQELGRPDEAEARLLAARHRHTANADVAIALARHAARRQDWEAALRAWENVRERWPDRPEGPPGAAEALVGLGRTASA